MLGPTPHRRSNFSAPRNSSLEPPGQSRPGYDPVELFSQEGSPEVWLQNHAALSRQIHHCDMILTFGDEPLTNTVSTLCPRCFATTPRRLLLGKGGPQRPGQD